MTNIHKIKPMTEQLAKRGEMNEKANYLADLILGFTDKAWVSFSDAGSGWEHLEADIEDVRPLAQAYLDLAEIESLCRELLAEVEAGRGGYIVIQKMRKLLEAK